MKFFQFVRKNICLELSHYDIIPGIPFSIQDFDVYEIIRNFKKGQSFLIDLKNL